jgi:peroxiredoxin
MSSAELNARYITMTQWNCKSNRFAATAVALTVISTAALIGARMISAATPAGGLEIGSTAPKFTLTDVATGTSSSLDDLRQGKKATVIMFIATRCPISNAYNDRMESLAKSYDKKHIEFVGINSNTTEPTDEVASHAKDHNFSFPVLKDADDAVADAYNAHVTPETFVVDVDGKIVYHGRIDNSVDPANVATNDLSTALDDIVAGKAVTKPEAKAFGCSIKRAH